MVGLTPVRESAAHDQSCPDYSVHLRQLVNISFNVAAEKGEESRDALHGAREIAGRRVTDNLYDRHIKPLFVGA